MKLLPMLIVICLLTLFVHGCSTKTSEDNTPEVKVEATPMESPQANEEPAITPEPPAIEEDVNTIEEIDQAVEEIVNEPSSTDITLTAQKTDNSVILTWTKYSGPFKSYKVVRAVTNANPSYPGYSLVKTIVNENETTFTDIRPENGISYYAITALGPYNEKTNSNPVKVEFPDPRETPDQEITLTAELTEKGVQLSWSPYNGAFLFYKIVRTTDHPYPKYPDDSTIETIGYVNQTTYLDTKPEKGVNYYAVTIIRPDKSKFTSSRASVTVTK
jgi:hypothetical protein